MTHIEDFTAAAGARATALAGLPTHGPVLDALVAEVATAAEAEAVAVRSIAGRPIETAADAADAAAVLGRLVGDQAWPDEAVAIARALAGAVERLALEW